MNSSGFERHGLVAVGALDPIVLVPERDADRVGGDEPAVGDRDPVGVAGQIGQHLPRARRTAACYRRTTWSDAAARDRP